MLFLVAFATEKDDTRDQIVKCIKKLGNWGRIMDNVYVVHTNEYTGKQIRDIVSVFFSASDRVFVTDISDSSWWTTNIPPVVRDFLRKHS